MSKTNTGSTQATSKVSRRKFLAATGAAATFTIMPRSVLGGVRHVSPSGKINIAIIGVGSQGLRVMLSFLRHEDVQVVAVCDPNRQSANYPQWSKSEFCHAVRRLLGTSSGWEWLSPNQPVRLTRVLTASSG